MVGFSSQNKGLLNSVYICPHCLLLLRDPIQLTNCGHRLCQSCTNEQESDMIICSECHETTSRKALILDRGFKNDMQNLSITCEFCNWTDLLKNYQNHLDQIHSNPICTYCNKNFTSVDDLNRHKRYDCVKITIDCPLKQFGCNEMILRINLSKHYTSEVHQKTLINIVQHLKLTIPNIMCDNLKIPSLITENTTNQLEEIFDIVNILSGGIETLNDDLQRLTTESIHYRNSLDPLIKDLAILKTSVQEQNSFLDGIKINQDISQQDLSSIQQNVNDMKTRSYDGTLIWKITNVQEKMVDAQCERQTSIYSPPFYSSSTGYKMCLRLYLYGDGNARRTHISLFFVLMRSEYDPILKFPFYFKVTFCLYDQTKQHNHILDSFRPDIKSNSFQRPRSNMNIASGIPKFIPITMLQQENNVYIREDTMFIKVMIDFDDMPKTLLPYALNLNPGLPKSIQQAMIRQEIDKRQEQQEKLSTSSITNTETNQSVVMNLQQTDTIMNISTNTDVESINSTNDNINPIKD